MTDTDFNHDRATDGLPQQEDTTYNGWTNYPTWAVNLWLSNDEGLYHMTRAIAAEVVDDSNGDGTVPTYWTPDEYRRFTLADRLKDWVTDDLAPDLGATFAADLLGYALGCVDWEEIANSWLEDAVEAMQS